jgi:hypothetical protein
MAKKKIARRKPNLQLVLDDDVRAEIERLSDYYGVSMTDVSAIALKVLFAVLPTMKGLEFTDHTIIKTLKEKMGLREIK